MTDLARVVLIDLSSLFWNSWHATAAKTVSEARVLTLSAVRRCFKEGDLVAVCCDGGRSFRKDLLADYKANRPDKDLNAVGELREVKARLKAEGFLLWEANTFEADDVIATACRTAGVLGHEVLVCSADKDLLQLVCNAKSTLLPEVRALRTHTWNEIGQDELFARFGVLPDQLGDWLALTGDSSDNIRGAKGIGEKRATELLTKYGNLATIFRAVTTREGEFTPAIRATLKDPNTQLDVELARKLVALRFDVPFDFREIYEKRETAMMPEETGSMEDDAPEISSVGWIDREAKEVIPVPERPKDGDVAAPATVQVEFPIRSSTPTSSRAIAAPASESAAKLAPGVTYDLALEPQSPDAAYKMAAYLYGSLLYPKFPNKEAIFAIMVRGREIGIPALTALDCFHVVEGKPAPHAHLIIALGMKHPECDYIRIVETTDKLCTYETKSTRYNEPTRLSYTIEQAVAAGLCALEPVPRTAPPGEKDKRGMWDKRRAEQLRKTCGVQLVRIVYPSAALGLTSYEEMGGDE